MGSGHFGSVTPLQRAAIRERMLYFGGGALLFSLAAVIALIAYSYNEVEAYQELSVPSRTANQVAFGSIVLLAPQEPVPHGTKLELVAMRDIHWPRNEVPAGALRPADSFAELYASADLPANQPILRANLSSTPLLGGVADLIPSGHRATTIEVDSTSGVEGWATPGAHVDVLVTYHDKSIGEKKTQIAIEDAVVVSFNGQTRKASGNRGETARNFSSNATVTLAVPVVDAVKLHTARAMGSISLLLRNTSDLKSVGSSTVTASDLQNADRPREKSGSSVGFVRYTDESGIAKELQLRSDRRWYLNNEE